MRVQPEPGRILFFFFLLFIFCSPGFSQTYQFKNYSGQDGLSGGFVYTVNQDSRGFIWIGTGSGISLFDGKEFYNIQLPDSSSKAFPVTSISLEDGSIVFGLSDGKVCRSDGNLLHYIEGIEASRINAIIKDTNGLLLFLSQNTGIFRYDPNGESSAVKLASAEDYMLFSGTGISESSLLLGTNRGLFVLNVKGDELEPGYEVEELEYRQIQSVVPFPSGQNFVIGTEDDGIYILKEIGDSLKVSRLFNDDELNRMRIRNLKFDRLGNLWISTLNDGVLKVKFVSGSQEVIDITRFTAETGLGGNNAQTIFFDKEENAWIGLYGNGISVLASDAYSLLIPGQGKKANNIVALFELGNNVFAGTDRGYYIYDIEKKNSEEFIDLGSYLGSSRITSYSKYKDGSYLFGTDINGAFILEKSGRVRPVMSVMNNLDKQISSIIYDGKYIWLATRGGVIAINESSRELTRYTNVEGLPHNSINEIISDGEGGVYVATQGNRLYTINPEDGVAPGKAVIYGGGRTEFEAFDIAPNGAVWGATSGGGIFKFANDSVFRYTTEDGLLNNICNSILVDSRNNVWVGHSTGFSVYDYNLRQIRTFEDIFKTGAAFNKRSACEAGGNYVLMGTQEGFMKYNPKLDQSRLIPPTTNIISVTIDDIEYPYRSNYNLPYKLRYNITVKYAGLFFSDPEKVYYKSKLDNYDTEWSDPTFDRELEYKLSDGEYRFNLISYNYDGVTDNNIIGFDLLIKKPIWRLWWFIGLMVLTGAIVIVIIVRVRERAQKRVKEYLEKELEERTSEVIKQKEEIEYQNREITDSINYAQRIQAGLLPSTSKLNENFDGAFTFYRPRDIVSGDFYWFDRISDERFILICADSTGHGVPGAFMSMIGSALIQEIVLRREVSRPSEILKALDKEVSATLNQSVDENSTSDGMDIIVCEFNLKTRLFRFASAMRPVIIVMDGEQYYIRGNKNSVGGESVAEKYFDDQEYFLKKGDAVYLFSDGYPDQFGGPLGKKLKIIRLKNLIEEIKNLPMNQQYKVVSDFFDEWKGDQEQVDDVLFMGVTL